MSSEIDAFVEYIKLKAECYKALMSAYAIAEIGSAILETMIEALKKVEEEAKKQKSEKEG